MKKIEFKKLLKILACSTTAILPMAPVLPSIISNNSLSIQKTENSKVLKCLDVSSEETKIQSSVLKSYNLLLGVESISDDTQSGIKLDSNSDENKLYVEIFENNGSDSILLSRINTSKNKWTIKTVDGTKYNAFWSPVIKDGKFTSDSDVYKQYDVLFNFAQVYSNTNELHSTHNFYFKFYMANSSQYVEELSFQDSWSTSNGYTLLSNSLEFDKDIDDSLNAYIVHDIRLYPTGSAAASEIDWNRIDQTWVKNSVIVDYTEFSQNFCKYPDDVLPTIDDNDNPEHLNIDLLNPAINADSGYIQFDLRFDGDKTFVIDELANLYFYFCLKNVPIVGGSNVDIYANCNTNIHFADYFNFKWWYVGIPIISIVIITLVSLLIWYIVKCNKAPKRFKFSKMA